MPTYPMRNIIHAEFRIFVNGQLPGSSCGNSAADNECDLHYVSDPWKTAQVFLMQHAHDLHNLRTGLAHVCFFLLRD